MSKSLFVTVAVVMSITIGIYILRNFLPQDFFTNATDLANTERLDMTPTNPLLTATRSQFDRWLPAYCGPDLYLERKVKPHTIEVCIHGTIERVRSNAGVQITKNDVIDPRVKAHWKIVMGAN